METLTADARPLGATMKLTSSDKRRFLKVIGIASILFPFWLPSVMFFSVWLFPRGPDVLVLAIWGVVGGMPAFFLSGWVHREANRIRARDTADPTRPPDGSAAASTSEGDASETQ